MKDTQNRDIIDNEYRMGQEMSTISFFELMQELTGASFEGIYKEYREEQNNEQGYLE